MDLISLLVGIILVARNGSLKFHEQLRKFLPHSSLSSDHRWLDQSPGSFLFHFLYSLSMSLPQVGCNSSWTNIVNMPRGRDVWCPLLKLKKWFYPRPWQASLIVTYVYSRNNHYNSRDRITLTPIRNPLELEMGSSAPGVHEWCQQRWIPRLKVSYFGEREEIKNFFSGRKLTISSAFILQLGAL